MVTDQERDKTLERIWQQYKSNKETDQYTPTQGRGYTCCADCYYTQRFLRKEHEQRPGGHPEYVRDCCSQSQEQSHGRWHTQHGEDRPQGLYECHVTPERAPHGHPLGRGHPKRVLQEFHDAFHSTREEQSDTVPDSGNETEEEKWDDIIAFDTETSRYTTVADQDHCIVRDHHRTNKHRC